MQTNVGKTADMVCCLCQSGGTNSEVAHGRRMTGEGPSYRERQRRRVQCKECGEEKALGSLVGHMRT